MTKEEFARVGLRLLAIYLSITYSFHLVVSLATLSQHPFKDEYFSRLINAQYALQFGYVLLGVFMYKYAPAFAKKL